MSVWDAESDVRHHAPSSTPLSYNVTMLSSANTINQASQLNPHKKHPTDVFWDAAVWSLVETWMLSKRSFLDYFLMIYCSMYNDIDDQSEERHHHYIGPLNMKGCIYHLTKWLIHPFISKGTIYIYIYLWLGLGKITCKWAFSCNF